MDVREKLVELLCEVQYLGGLEEKIADHLVSNGVTVQEGKPLEAFLHPIDAYKGLKAKYLVFKADTGAKVDNCFILRPDKDHTAVEALRAYANATDNETLAEDIYRWVGNGEPVQEWISVKDKLPEIVSTHKRYRSTIKKSIRVMCVCVQKSGKTMVKEGYCEWYNDYPDPRWQIPGTIDEVTHWQHLPQPPKGE
jgi:hypothetical protein